MMKEKIMTPYDDELENNAPAQAAQDRELIRATHRLERLAALYANTTTCTVYIGAHVDWSQHIERMRHASRAVARAFLNGEPRHFTAADAQRVWANAMLGWCSANGETPPPDALSTFEQMALGGQLAEMEAVRAMRAAIQ
jgi:hypothetical protein